MSQSEALLGALKRELKARGLTYADVAEALELSESSIKRLLTGSRLSLQRLERLCELLDMDIAELVRKMTDDRQRIQRLTTEQEQQVAADPKLLLVALCALNGWSMAEIVDTYVISDHDCIQLLARLDRLKIVDLLPGNRIRLVVASDFQWIPNGPIQRFFRKEVQPAFLQASFNGPGEKLLFRSGMLSRAANADLLRRMEKLIADFNDLHEADAGLPLGERYGSSLLVALRPWEFSYFRELRRDPAGKPFPGSAVGGSQG